MAKARQGNPQRNPEEELSEIADDMESVTPEDEMRAGSTYEMQEDLDEETEEGGALEASMSDGDASATEEGGRATGGRQRGQTVADCMTPEPRTVTPETSIEDAAMLFAEVDSGALPVVESEDDLTPIGMITDRDIVTRVLAHGEDPFDLTVADCMTTPALTIGQDDDVEDAVRMLEQAQVRRAIVVDDEGQCCGIVAQADLAFAVDDALAAEMLRAISRPTEEEARIPS